MQSLRTALASFAVLLSVLISGCGGSIPSSANPAASGTGNSSAGTGSAGTGSGATGGSSTGSNTGSSSGDGSGSSTGAPANAIVLSNLQASSGWNSWGELPPVYAICSAPCSGVTWSMAQAQQSPSLSANSTQFNLGGVTPYADVLWSLPVIGQFSTQGLPDADQTLVPTLHNFIYDTWFYINSASATQALEFDVNLYMNGSGMTWGHQCRIAGGNEWDIWDNVNAAWVPTGVACNPTVGGWNHVTIQVQRLADNTLVFQSITFNGVTAQLNKTYPPFTVPQSWYGITVNYQMDGNFAQAANTSYLDNFTLTSW